jgi:hypothetical protein
MKSPKTGLLQGTLDLLILRTLASGDMHGWGISQHLQQLSRDVLQRCGNRRRASASTARVSRLREIADYRAQTRSLDAVVEYHQMAFPCLGPASRAAAIDPMRALRAD